MQAGYKNLGVFNITGTEVIEGDWEEDLEGVVEVLFSIRLSYGSSSGSPRILAYLQTNLDDNDTPCDIACVQFDVASEHKVLNFSALTPKTTQVTPTNKTLSADTAVDGILGNKFRVVLSVTGTYAGSTQVIAGINVR